MEWHMEITVKIQEIQEVQADVGEDVGACSVQRCAELAGNTHME